MPEAELRIIRGGRQRIAELEPVYASLHEHHRAVAPALGGMPARAVGEAWERRRAKYEEWLARSDAFVLVAEREGGALGYALVSPSEAYQGWVSRERVADVHELAVMPEERGRGIGTALLDAAERELDAIGICEYRLLVIAPNRDAIRFYERRGMAIVSHVLLGRVGQNPAGGS